MIGKWRLKEIKCVGKPRIYFLFVCCWLQGNVVSHENTKCQSWIWIQVYLNAGALTFPLDLTFIWITQLNSFESQKVRVYTLEVGDDVPVLIGMHFFHLIKNLVWSTAFVWPMANFDFFFHIKNNNVIEVFNSNCFSLDKYLMCILHLILTTKPQIV